MPLSYRQQKYLNKLSHEMPDEIKENITEEQEIWAEEKAKLKNFLKYLDSPRGKKKFTSLERERLKKKVNKLLDSDMMDAEEEVVNDEITEKAEKYWEDRIGRAIKTGKIEPAEVDGFMEKMAKKTDSGKLFG